VEIFLDVHDLTFHKTAAITENADDSTQAINVPVLRPNDFVSSTKIDTMLEILAETRRATNNADKTVIFTQFTTMLDLIEKPLKAAGYKYVRYDGSMNMAAKNAAIQRLKDDPTTTIMIISMKCGSLGLNLTAANRVIVCDMELFL
jgi:SNF2 family DNA or RNA helicase